MKPTHRRLAWIAVAVAAVSPFLAAVGDAHELAETSAALVVREGGHYELRLQVAWADVLRARLMPRADAQEFLMRVANQPAADFAREVRGVEQAIERGLMLGADADKPVAFGGWSWPAPQEIQGALRQELMSRVADGANFVHASRLPATSELVTGREARGVRVQLPALLGPALLTVSRPTEEWVRPGSWSSSIPVGRSSPR